MSYSKMYCPFFFWETLRLSHACTVLAICSELPLSFSYYIMPTDFCRVVISTSPQWGAEVTILNVPADWKGTCLSQMLFDTLALKFYRLYWPSFYQFFLCRMASLAHTLGALPYVSHSVLCILPEFRFLLWRPASNHQAMECSERGPSISWKPEPVVNLAATSVFLLLSNLVPQVFFISFTWVFFFQIWWMLYQSSCALIWSRQYSSRKHSHCKW
jgi:hypothetical protein